MYVPKNMEMVDEKGIVDFISEFGFGLLISPSLEATHLPLIYQPQENTKGFLYGHFAKANPQWKNLANQQVLIVFSGPHSYISPNWYVDKPAVPTWNYVAVHCYGRCELLDDDSTLASMDTLVKKYEPDLLQDESMIPSEYRKKLSQAVVGFRVAINNIQAKEKLGQHRKEGDQKGVYEGLTSSTHPDAKGLAGYMKARQIGLGS